MTATTVLVLTAEIQFHGEWTLGVFTTQDAVNAAARRFEEEWPDHEIFFACSEHVLDEGT